MKSISGAMDAHLSGAVTSICTCWKITRKDGEVLGFTDHDRSLTIGSIIYKAATGYYRSAISNSADSGVDNLDVSGFLDDDSLDEVELRNGAYDYAEVEVFAVNWADLSQGIVRLRFGYFGEVMIVSSGFFKVELRGLTQLFAQTIGETYSPECRADLGDEKCRVPLVPNTRRAAANYAVGSRFIVPQEPGASVNIAVGNPGFETNVVGTNWPSLTGSHITINYDETIHPYDASEEPYSIRPTSEDGSVRFLRLASQVGTNPLDFSANINVTTAGGAPQARLLMYWGSIVGVPDDTNPDSVITGPWVALVPGMQTLTLDATTFERPPGGSKRDAVFWVVEWLDIPADTQQIPFFGGTVYALKINPFPKMSGETFAQATLIPVGLPQDTSSGWTLSAGNSQLSGPNVWMSPYGGDWMMELFPGPHATATVYQDILIPTEEPDYLAIVDAGEMFIRLNVQEGAETVAVSNHISYRFYDAVDAQIGLVEEAPKPIHGRGFWRDHYFDAPIPALTRRVRIHLNTTNTSDNARARGVYDNVALRMFEDSYENQESYLVYGGVEFVCTQEGTTDIETPVYNYALGAVTVDGSAQFTASQPLHMFTLTITEVVSNKVFKVANTVDKPNDWFEWGVVEMLDGLNVKKKVEVMSWDNATKTITLALPLPYIPLVGQKLRMHTGCAKSRDVCVNKFNNMHNYRGEPDLPGTDQYFKIGGANVGGSAPAGGGKS